MDKSASNRGFTLVEIMVVVIIVGILAAVALPGYMDQVRKGRRSDAFDAMVLVQQQQERHRSQNAQYAADFDALKVPATSAAGHYKLSLSDVTGVGYVLTAKPSDGGKQGADKACAVLTLVVNKGSSQRTATDNSGKDSTSTCWPQ